MTYPKASALRRFSAMVYDFCLILAIWILTTITIVANVDDEAAITYRLAFQGVLLLELFLFYGYFWTLKGQTLGMQVWKIRSENFEGGMLNWSQASIRFFLACITPAFGFLWMLVDKDSLTLYDRYSKTRVVYTGDKPFAKEQQQGQEPQS